MEDETSNPECPAHSGVCLRSEPDIGLPLQRTVVDQTNEITGRPVQYSETNINTQPKDTRQKIKTTEDGETTSKTTQVGEINAGAKRETTQNDENITNTTRDAAQDSGNDTGRQNELKQDGGNGTRRPSENSQDRDNKTRTANEITQDGENGTRPPSETTQDLENGTIPPIETTQDLENGTRPPSESTKDRENGNRPPSETTQDLENGTIPPSESTKDRENGNRPPSETTQDPENGTRPPSEITQDPENGTRLPSETTQDGENGARPHRKNTQNGDCTRRPSESTQDQENGIRTSKITQDQENGTRPSESTQNVESITRTQHIKVNKASDSRPKHAETESMDEVSRTGPSAMVAQGVEDIPAIKTAIQEGTQEVRVLLKSPRSDTNVSFQSSKSEHIDPAEKLKEAELPEGVQRLKKELERMQFEDDKKRNAEKAKKKEEVAKLKAKLKSENKRQKIAVDLNTDLHKTFIAGELAKEELIALAVERNRLNEETRQMARYLDKKHAITERRKAGGTGRLLKKMEKDAKRPPRQDDITRELTRDEVTDLHMAFDMFDKKRRGLLTISDLKRLGKMLKLPVSKDPLKTMIAEWDKKKRGVVEFEDFLTLVITAQGDGPDPYEEITQGFDMIDVEGKGFITFDDLRKAADETGERFSNTMLREMVTEADCTGDGRITQRDFVRIMLDTNRYRVIKKAMNL